MSPVRNAAPVSSSTASSCPDLPRRVHSFGADALGDADATGVAERIRSGAVSVREVVDAAVARLQAVNPVLDAVAVADFDAAIAKASQPHAGPFAGVPTFIKDNTDLRGLPTGHGSEAVNPRPAKGDAPFAKQLLAQGFVCLGKSRMPEFGLNASTEFQGGSVVRNPWHTGFSPGASSGGAAALVAAGVVPMAHANDGGGSTRIPAACCGLIGLKPTRGRLLEPESSRALPVRLVTEGVVTRSVRDTARFYAAAETYYRNGRLPEIGLVEGPAQRRLRVGVLFDSLLDHPTDTATRSAVQNAADLLAGHGHHVTPMPLRLSRSFADDFSIYWGMLSFLIGALGKHAVSPAFERHKLDPFTRGLASHFTKNFWRAPAVILRLRRIEHEYAAMFQDVDVILSPVLAHVPPPLGYLSPDHGFEILFERLLRYVAFTPLNNVSGGPGISLPLGASAEGVPIGVHVSAKHGDERTLLELAFEIEQVRPWRRIQDHP